VSFIAVAVRENMGHIDLGHTDAGRSSNLKIPEKDITEAMVCMTCFKRDFLSEMLQCGTCKALWHNTCTIIPLDRTRDDNKLPIDWTCSSCTAKLRSSAGSDDIRERMIAMAREKRAQSVRPDADLPKSGGGGGGGGKPVQTKTVSKNQSFSKNSGVGVSAYSGHHLGHKSSRAFFTAKRSSSKKAAAAASAAAAADDDDESVSVPKSSEMRDVDDDDDFDEEFANSVADGEHDL
jgi:hypothetical protein